jgi:hypothetical protein
VHRIGIQRTYNERKYNVKVYRIGIQRRTYNWVSIMSKCIGSVYNDVRIIE